MRSGPRCGASASWSRRSAAGASRGTCRSWGSSAWRRPIRFWARAGSRARGSTSRRTCCATRTIATRWSSGTSKAGSARSATASCGGEVAAAAAAFAALGVGAGDRVAGFLPNLPETVIAMLAAASLGAVWSSCSPDFGANGVLDRFGQIRPKLLVCADGYRYAGKLVDSLARVREVRSRIPEIEHVVVVPYLAARPDLGTLPGALGWADLLDSHRGPESPEVRPPAVRSSALHHVLLRHHRASEVHGARGGRHAAAAPEGARAPHRPVPGRPALLFHHLRLDDVELAGLGARRRCDGGAVSTGRRSRRGRSCGTWPRPKASPSSAPAPSISRWPRRRAWRRAARTISRPSAPCSRPGARSRRTATTTSTPPSSATFISRASAAAPTSSPALRWAIPSRLSGAASCRREGSAWRWRCSTPTAVPCRGREGELVCTRPFPSMPVAFWDDPDGSRYRAAYFEAFPGVWRHGDWARLTEHDGLVILGRSDATLNPGGVRIGTAEIYRQVEQLPEVVESLVVGQDWDGDVRIVLFVRLREGLVLEDGAAGPDPAPDSGAREPSPRAAQDFAGGGHPPHDQRQDHRIGRSGRHSRAAGQKRGCAGQSGCAGAVSGFGGSSGLIHSPRIM